MSDAPRAEQFLSQAMECEQDYDWLGAVRFYEKALGLLPEMGFLRMVRFQERVGYDFYRAAMQAKSVDRFRKRMRQAIASYENAKESYGRLSKSRRTPWMLRCDAMIAYIGYWLASEAPQKKKLIDECWQLTKEALKAFKNAKDFLEYGKTYNQLSSSAYQRYELEWKFQARKKIVREAMDYGEQAITLLPSVGDSHELAKAYAKTASYLTTFGWVFISDIDAKMSYFIKGRGYWQKANELSKKTASLELLSKSEGTESWSVDEMLMHYEEALGCARKTKDKHLTGTALDKLAYASYWKSMRIEDPDKRVQIIQKALQYAEEAKQQFSSISFASPRGDTLWVGTPHAEYYWVLALWESDPGKRRDLLEKAVTDGSHAIKLAEGTGYPEIIFTAHHVLSKMLVSLAQIETNSEEKRKLLEKALEHRNESIRISEQLAPLNYWSRGVMWNYLADLKAELSNIEKVFESIKSTLEEAILDKELCLQLCIRDSLYFEKIGELSYFAALGYYQHSYGVLLSRLHELTSSGEHQRKAIKAFEQAAETYQKLNLFSYAAECLWKTARGSDALGEHLNAAEKFNLASNNYKSAAEKIPQLKDFYQDHACYMQAWSEIEKARHHHSRQEYGLAREHYEKTAAMHKSLKQWSYLAPNYSAWSQVENAEDLSRREQSEEALQAFEQAAELFTETKKSIQTQLNKIENPDEKQMATNLIKATDQRHEYCIGRIALEEAKILDKKGEHNSSSEKYGSAAQTFQKMTEASESEQDQKELKLITTLSKAWQKMTRAEAEESPNLYIEASQLFEEAKELTINEKARMLALGHSRFCRALEAGTKFADTRDITLYAIAIQHLESAANYYVKTGFQNASEYTKATELLLDAYMHMDNAKKENDPEKKARLYIMAEKVLQTSADSFMKAAYLEKREQVQRLLEKVKEERELAMSLSEVLHAPSIISATTAFATPTPTQENAVGLEKFEHGHIQANVTIRRKNLRVGDDLGLEIELVNAGKGAALLTKITEIIPEGFELKEKPENYSVEDSYLNMKGRRLDPLKTEEVKLILRPLTKGVFLLKPRVLYLDETGEHKSHEPEPITIIVKELGISGWLKGQ